MTTDRKSVISFLNVTKSRRTIDQRRLGQLRSAYDTMMDTPTVGTTTTSGGDPLKQLAQLFELSDDATNLEYLSLCVTASSMEAACDTLSANYLDMKSSEIESTNRAIHQMTTHSASIITQSVSLTQVICQILVKQNLPDVIEFIHNFLLCPLAQTASIHSNNTE